MTKLGDRFTHTRIMTTHPIVEAVLDKDVLFFPELPERVTLTLDIPEDVLQDFAEILLRLPSPEESRAAYPPSTRVNRKSHGSRERYDVPFFSLRGFVQGLEEMGLQTSRFSVAPQGRRGKMRLYVSFWNGPIGKDAPFSNIRPQVADALKSLFEEVIFTDPDVYLNVGEGHGDHFLTIHAAHGCTKEEIPPWINVKRVFINSPSTREEAVA